MVPLDESLSSSPSLVLVASTEDLEQDLASARGSVEATEVAGLSNVYRVQMCPFKDFGPAHGTYRYISRLQILILKIRKLMKCFVIQYSTIFREAGHTLPALKISN